MIIDCHGHYTTAPPQLEGWRKRIVERAIERAGLRGTAPAAG